jgi:hypothetical protein
MASVVEQMHTQADVYRHRLERLFARLPINHVVSKMPLTFEVLDAVVRKDSAEPSVRLVMVSRSMDMIFRIVGMRCGFLGQVIESALCRGEMVYIERFASGHEYRAEELQYRVNAGWSILVRNVDIQVDFSLALVACHATTRCISENQVEGTTPAPIAYVGWPLGSWG